MIEHELEKIKRSFVRAKGCCTEIACLLSIIKYYDGNETIESLSQWYIPESNQTLTALKQVAEHIGMTAYLCQLDMEQLAQKRLPLIIFAKNDFGEPDFAVCYGLHEGRFIVWEPQFGPMQYWPEEMKRLWILGICMAVYPSVGFKTSCYLKWWELYSWSRKIKKKLEHIKEYISLEILPWFRW